MARLENRPNLSEELRGLIREQIVDGELPADSRINEVRLAESLGVSRTPLREALTGLVAEGALFTVPRRGFFVKALSAAEFESIYPIRALLDPEALRLSGLPSRGRIARLESLNRRLHQTAKVERRIELDDAWHLELVADCPNPVLLQLIREFILRTRRYELAFYRDRRNLEISTADHDRVIAACKRRDMEGALEALGDNLTSGIGPILEWLAERSRSLEAAG